MAFDRQGNGLLQQAFGGKHHAVSGHWMSAESFPYGHYGLVDECLQVGMVGQMDALCLEATSISTARNPAKQHPRAA